MSEREKYPIGTIARLAMQCKHPVSGKIGDFLFLGDSHRDPESVVSECFPDYVDFYNWARANKWVSQWNYTYIRQ
jgi:hypothetical protein